jgi:Cu/Ag efflux protein CusF
MTIKAKFLWAAAAALLVYFGPASPQSKGAELADGEVRKVDKDAKKITIKHGPLANLDMPPMTMVFQVKDPAMLERVKAGDRVKFQAEKLGGAYTVTRIEPAK